MVCLNGGTSFGNDGIHPYLGVGIGPDVGVSGKAGVDMSKSTGATGGVSCQPAVGPVGSVGVYGEVGANDSDKSIYGGGGYAPGAELGCAAEFNYVF